MINPLNLLGTVKTGWTKVKPHLAQWAPTLIAVGILVVAFNRQGPERVVERYKEVEVTKTDTRIDELLKQVETLNKQLTEVRTTQTKESYRKWELAETKPDGTSRVEKTEERNIDSHTKEEKVLTEVKVVEVEKQVVAIQTVTVEKITETEKIVESSPRNWRVSPMVGVGFDVKPGPTFNGVVYGAAAEGRIFKNVWVGVWGVGNSQVGGIVGAQVSIEF